MHVDVDPAGRDDPAARVEDLRGIARGDARLDRADAAALDADVGHAIHTARRIDHAAAFHDEVVARRGGAELRCDRDRAGGGCEEPASREHRRLDHSCGRFAVAAGAAVGRFFRSSG